MNLLDRRFLSISLSVQGIANQPAANPTSGTQYIVGSNPTGAFASAATNQIARYNGSDWTFFTPKTGELEVLNLDTGEVLCFNGSAWSAVASLSNNSSAASSANNVIPIDGIASLYAASFNANDYLLTQGNIVLTGGTPTCHFSVQRDNSSLYWASFYVNDGASYLCYPFTDSGSEHPFQLYVADNNSWLIQNVSEGAIFFNKSDSCLYSISDGVVSKISNNILVFDHFITTGYETPDNNTPGDFFLDFSSLRTGDEEGPSLYVNNNGSWDSSYFFQYEDEVFVSANHGCVFRWVDDTDSGLRAFLIHFLHGADLLFNPSDNHLYKYQSGSFVLLNGESSSSTSDPAFCTEAHSLTAAEVTAKSFSLANSIASGQENNTLLFVSGIAQSAGSDFTASGNTISWASKELDSMELHEGDSFIVHYVKA